MKSLFIINDPPYGTERVYNALHLAHALNKKDPASEVCVFLMADAVLAAKGAQKAPEGFCNIERMLKRVLAADGRVLLCGTCMDARGFADSELIEGACRSTPYYPETVDEIIGVEPLPGMLALAKQAIARCRYKVTLLDRPADDLPLDDRSVDTIVVTWSLRSILDVGWALMEARRVLRPGGHMRFVEDGLSPDPKVAIWQDRLTPLWRRCAGGCDR